MSNRYQEAKERYAKLGVDTEEAIRRLQNVSLSMHCWQGDDVRGFEAVSYTHLTNPSARLRPLEVAVVKEIILTASFPASFICPAAQYPPL